MRNGNRVVVICIVAGAALFGMALVDWTAYGHFLYGWAAW